MCRFFKLSELKGFLKQEGFIEELAILDDFDIKGFSSLYDTLPETLTWAKSKIGDLPELKAAVILCPKDFEIPASSDIVYIRVSNPRLAFIKVLQKFNPEKERVGVARTAIIGKNCGIGSNVYIGHYAVVGDNVKIGDNTQIHDNVVIYDGTDIGANCVIYAGTVIGADGFGYEREGKALVKFPHVGGVLIEDDVEIGSNTCIDRGTLSNTVIKKSSKIDNLCHIAHNVVIEENSAVIACSMIGGSTRIGKGSWIAPGAIIRDGLTIGADSVVGLGAVVIKNVKAGDTVAGLPARSLRKQA